MVFFLVRLLVYVTPHCGSNHSSEIKPNGFLSNLLTPITQDTTVSTQLAESLSSKAFLGNDLYPSVQQHG